MGCANQPHAEAACFKVASAWTTPYRAKAKAAIACCSAGGLKATATDYLNFETRSANSSMTLAASAAAVPVGSPLYVILGLEK